MFGNGCYFLSTTVPSGTTIGNYPTFGGFSSCKTASVGTGPTFVDYASLYYLVTLGDLCSFAGNASNSGTVGKYALFSGRR